MNRQDVVTIYTDGASRGNPGSGGYGTIMIYKNHRKELSEGFRKTTNNRMELLAVIEGLSCLKKEGLNVVIYSDSKYVVDSIEKKWVFNWYKKRFKDKKNADLWMRFLPLYAKHNVRMIWIKGHADNLENENCDRLAVEAALGGDLKVDEGYEKGN